MGNVKTLVDWLPLYSTTYLRSMIYLGVPPLGKPVICSQGNIVHQMSQNFADETAGSVYYQM